MTTVETAILIIDDDGDERVGSNDGDKSSELRLKDNEKEALKTFMEILDITDEEFAKKKLKEVSFNVELAISISFESCQSASIPKHGHQHRKISDVDNTSNSAESTTFSRATSLRKASPCEDRLSDLWHDCYNKSTIPFVDPEFPPTRISLDGRKDNVVSPVSSNRKLPHDDGTDNHSAPFDSTSSNDIILCFCKLPASARTVQSDGPNYGRFYLACGQKNVGRRWQQRSKDNTGESDKAENNTADVNQDGNKTSNGHK